MQRVAMWVCAIIGVGTIVVSSPTHPKPVWAPGYIVGMLLVLVSLVLSMERIKDD